MDFQAIKILLFSLNNFYLLEKFNLKLILFFDFNLISNNQLLHNLKCLLFHNFLNFIYILLESHIKI